MNIIIKVLATLACYFAALPMVNATQVQAHDPVMAQENGVYYLFSTGPGVTIYTSTDKVHWRQSGRVFKSQPSWARKVAPDFNGHLWAPDIIKHNDKFYLYYSVSAFGQNTSAIGVTVNKTLDPQSADYQWVDQGIVLQSVPFRDNWNAIDPAVIHDKDGTPWMSFGSFWGGLKLVKLNSNLTELAQPQTWYDLATRPNVEYNPIEAPFIFYKNGYYYLFASFDFCCRGVKSTYKTVVGRSKYVDGPYLDKNGKSMLEGGGTPVLTGNKDWAGVGHNSVYTFDNQDYIVLHAYEMATNGTQRLRILPITWQDGWPVVSESDLNTHTTELVSD